LAGFFWPDGRKSPLLKASIVSEHAPWEVTILTVPSAGLMTINGISPRDSALIRASQFFFLGLKPRRHQQDQSQNP
jgi:hypothetical protein